MSSAVDEKVYLQSDPIELFENWFKEAYAIDGERATVMSLATASKRGRPSVRYVLFKGMKEGGLSFFTNYKSRKAKEISENPYGALAFYWAKQERQIRIEGRIKKLSEKESYQYFCSRPLEKRIGAWASPQSSAIPNRKVLEKRIQDFTARFQNCEEVPLPPYWGGYILIPSSIEFWIGQEFRWHDRFLFKRAKAKWKVQRLAP